MKKLTILLLVVMLNFTGYSAFSSEKLYFTCINIENESTRAYQETIDHPSVTAKMRFQNDLLVIHGQNTGFTRNLLVKNQEDLDSDNKLVYVILKRGTNSPIDTFIDQVKILYQNRECTIIEARSPVIEILQNKLTNHFDIFPFEGEIILRVTPEYLGIHKNRSIDSTFESINPDKSRIDNDIRTLVNFKTRYTYTDKYNNSAVWCQQQFEEMGYEAKLVEYPDYKEKQYNVVAQKKGGCSENFYIVSAHLDSISPKVQIDAPGADDNASGCAGVLEMARLMKDMKEVNNIRFVLYGGEEVGLKGSKAYVDQLIKNKEASKVKGVVIFDMIGFDRSGNLSSLVETKDFSKDFISTFVQMAKDLGTLDTTISFRPWGSDHVPFLNKKIPCFLFIEDEFDANSNYHQVTDLPDEINLDLTKEIVRITTAGLIKLLTK